VKIPPEILFNESYVLALDVQPYLIRVSLDFVLTPQHPKYTDARWRLRSLQVGIWLERKESYDEEMPPQSLLPSLAAFIAGQRADERFRQS
jgi:hypothetical protein